MSVASGFSARFYCIVWPMVDSEHAYRLCQAPLKMMLVHLRGFATLLVEPACVSLPRTITLDCHLLAVKSLNTAGNVYNQGLVYEGQNFVWRDTANFSGASAPYVSER